MVQARGSEVTFLQHPLFHTSFKEKPSLSPGKELPGSGSGFPLSPGISGCCQTILFLVNALYGIERKGQRERRPIHGHKKPGWQFLFIIGKFQAMLLWQTLSQSFGFASFGIWYLLSCPGPEFLRQGLTQTPRPFSKFRCGLTEPACQMLASSEHQPHGSQQC